MSGAANKVKAGMKCLRCGACCHVDMVAYASPEDTQRWEKERRYNILAHLHDVMWSGDRIVDTSGTRITSCVYLKWHCSSFFCKIYETRPMVCRNFVPGSSDLCPLFNRNSRLNPISWTTRRSKQLMNPVVS